LGEDVEDEQVEGALQEVGWHLGLW
jgi:hypothetical protein